MLHDLMLDIQKETPQVTKKWHETYALIKHMIHYEKYFAWYKFKAHFVDTFKRHIDAYSIQTKKTFFEKLMFKLGYVKNSHYFEFQKNIQRFYSSMEEFVQCKLETHGEKGWLNYQKNLEWAKQYGGEPAIFNEFTLAIIKPDAFLDCINIRNILMEHFFIEKTKVGKYTREKAEEFYNMHKDQSFFEGLMKHTCSGKCMAMILRSRDGSDAIETLRKIIGNTDPKKAKKGSIRQLFGTELPKNAIHASDSLESFKREVKLIFGINWEF